MANAAENLSQTKVLRVSSALNFKQKEQSGISVVGMVQTGQLCVNPSVEGRAVEPFTAVAVLEGAAASSTRTGLVGFDISGAGQTICGPDASANGLAFGETQS